MQGRADEDGLVDDFVLGIIESTKELGSPFISESIWTEGLADIFVRRGRTRDNRQILWNEEDPIGDKLSKSIGHLSRNTSTIKLETINKTRFIYETC